MDELNKREFLKTTALLGTATVVPSIASAENQGVAAAAVVSPMTAGFDETRSNAGRGFFARLLLAFRRKTPFLANSFRPCFCETSVAGRDGGVSRDFEPFGSIELFGGDFGRGASCDDHDLAIGKAFKTCDAWDQKERLARIN